MDYSLYLVTDSSLSRGRSSLEVVDAAIRGGVTMVQYREKGATTRAMIEEARVLLELCRSRGVPFIVNDRADVALAVDADGLHVGQDDMPAALARRIIGNGRILGVSAGNVEEARRAAEDGADYIGASPVFSTPTKPDALPPMGTEGLRALSRAVRAAGGRDRRHQCRQRGRRPRRGRGGPRRGFGHRVRGRCRGRGAGSAKNNRRDEGLKQ